MVPRSWRRAVLDFAALVVEVLDVDGLSDGGAGQAAGPTSRWRIVPVARQAFNGSAGRERWMGGGRYPPGSQACPE